MLSWFWETFFCQCGKETAFDRMGRKISPSEKFDIGDWDIEIFRLQEMKDLSDIAGVIIDSDSSKKSPVIHGRGFFLLLHSPV